MGNHEMVKILLGLGIISMMSCAPSVKALKDKMQKLDWMAGEWRSSTGTYYEHITRKPDGMLKGRDFRISSVNKDTVEMETFEIKLFEGKIAYLATVKDQNKGATIPFTMQSSKLNKAVFVNKKHDFPQKITYDRYEFKRLHVWIEGKKGKRVDFWFYQP